MTDPVAGNPLQGANPSSGPQPLYTASFAVSLLLLITGMIAGAYRSISLDGGLPGPTSLDVHRYVHDLLELEDYQQSLPELERLLTISGQDRREVLIGLGDTLFQRRQLPAAIGFYRQAEQLAGDGRIHLKLGLAYAAEGRTQEAFDHLKRSVELSPKNAKAAYYYGLLLEDRLQTAEAIRYYREAVRLEPTLEKARRRLTKLLQRS